ncbi:MAG: phosphatidylserine decarboxylase [Bacteroidetes bacterium 4572_112]|nr:MAG: phosphatidylserine decarboxylase [Bacteroidetes bacterium 4572_112]
MKTNIRYKVLLASFIIILIVALLPSGENIAIQYVDRQDSQVKTEKVYGEAWLAWLYNNPVGRVTTATIVKRKFLSDIYGAQMDKPSSKDKIAGFVETYNIDLSICQKQEFDNFNDFFYRKLKKDARPIDINYNVVVSPADGKILAIADIHNQDFIVKGYRFNVEEFLQNAELAARYKDGSFMIIRLCPTDYHRYHFPVNGEIIFDSIINGDYYSVSPIALRKKVELICLNKRSVCEINTKQFGKVIMSEVAATMVGSMINTYADNQVMKGEERGYFKFGGSTVVLFFEKGAIAIDKDLLQNTINGLETEVKMGERIAMRL